MIKDRIEEEPVSASPNPYDASESFKTCLMQSQPNYNAPELMQ